MEEIKFETFTGDDKRFPLAEVAVWSSGKYKGKCATDSKHALISHPDLSYEEFRQLPKPTYLIASNAEYPDLHGVCESLDGRDSAELDFGRVKDFAEILTMFKRMPSPEAPEIEIRFVAEKEVTKIIFSLQRKSNDIVASATISNAFTSTKEIDKMIRIIPSYMLKAFKVFTQLKCPVVFYLPNKCDGITIITIPGCLSYLIAGISSR